jgi:DNA topoisomerase-2
MSSKKNDKSNNSSNEVSLDEKYQQKTDKEHILDNPDTYIGSIENVSGPMYIYDGSIIQKDIDYNPALYKLFDEGITNCRDHRVRTENKKKTDDSTDVVTSIHIEISNNKITMTNNGDGIDVEEHPTYKIWIPELIFGHLRTSTNYNKDEQKTTGGKNGFGFKLVLIWSTWGEIETVDAKRELKYHQVFENNLDLIHKPKITSCKKKPYTRVSFIPDYKRLGLEGLSDDMLKLFQRRVYDIAGITTKDVKVKYNEDLLPVKEFGQYVQLFNDQDKVGESHDCWSYSVCLSDEFKQISFVNGIFTGKGGKHVDYIVQQITKKMVAYILKKKKVEVKPSIIKEQITIFLNSTIVNPSFDSQTKDYLNTPASKFGSSCVVSDKFIEKLAALGVLNTSCELSDVKEKKESKKTDGAKTKTIRGIPKLIDANYAGTKKSGECILILCEGDSAKSGIVSGLAANDRNVYGIYPMKGKLLNVRGASSKDINGNHEITDIKKILGLESGKTYKDIEDLRYGKVLFMTDQDLDGSHIKGLGINMFECLWPSLLKISGFIGFMNTPILKATKGTKSLSFYNDNEYEAWKQTENGSGWKVKYYKGLGTSTGKEFREYFEHKKIVEIEVGEKDTEDMDMLFNKKKAEQRKEWLTNYDRDAHVDTSLTHISLGNFIHKEIIHFSKYDCDRSIPNLMDGLKVSQRKILFSAFEKNLVNEIKVAQFSGYVSEHSGYHHGEASLNGAIVHMAQDFVGSNNINLLMPNGQFGTRLQGGKDSASERYIFTKLNMITRFMFKKSDDAILQYLDDDGTPVEPIFYVPIIPLVLVNGAEGIGTGFSTKIPCFNPKELIQYIRDVIGGKTPNMDLVPYYKGFKGTITKDLENESRFITKGKYTLSKNKIDISELPIGTWNEDYIIFLEKLLEEGTIKDYKDLSTDKNVSIQIISSNDVDIEKIYKLTTTLSISNMNLFNEKEKLTHYTKPHEIIDDFILKRIGYYEKRKQYIIELLQKELVVLENKYKYIQDVLDGTIDLRKKTTEQIYKLLEGFVQIESSYNYLIKMTMDSVSIENVDTLKNQYLLKEKELEIIKKTTVEESWLNELNDLEKII